MFMVSANAWRARSAFPVPVIAALPADPPEPAALIVSSIRNAADFTAAVDRYAA
jgi:hypothetical protein